MKRNRINRDRRLLEALDYLDEAYIADVVDNLKVPPVPGAPMPKKGRILRSLKPVAMLVACTLLLAALIPAVTYLTSHIPDIVAFFRGEQSEATVPEETSPYLPDDTTSPPETTEAIKHEHNGSEGLVYRINDDGQTVTLVSRGNCDLKDVIVASVYDGMPVKAIADGAFTDAEIRTLTIPTSVTSIGYGAFKNCRELVAISLPEKLTDIGSNAFEGCTALRTIGLPSSLTLIPTGLFTNCENLARVTIQKTMKRILMGAFIGCTNLETIEYYGNKTEWNQIQKGDFWHMKSAIRSVDTSTGNIHLQPSPGEAPTHDGSKGLEYQLSGVEAMLTSLGTCTDTNVVVASTYMGYPVKWITAGVFEGYELMESLTLPETLVSISTRAFAGCVNLKSIYLGASMRTLYPDSFAGCRSLDTIEVDPNNTTFIAVDNCLIQKNNNQLILASNNAKIPADGSVKVIGKNAFSELNSIEEIVIPEGVTTIIAEAINNCPNLQKLSLPSTLTSFDLNYITGCNSISAVLFPSGHPIYTAEGNAISDKSAKTLILGFASTEIPDWVTTIGADAFKDCSGLVSIKLPDSLKTIKTGAFRGCTSLESVSISGNVSVMASAFQGCTALRYVELGQKVVLNGTYIFADCTSLESITIPEATTSVPSYLFRGCSSLSNIVLHEKISAFSTHSFADCPALTSFRIPASVTELPDYLFYGSSLLREIIYEGTRHEWHTVKKGYYWVVGSLTLITVRCADGDLSLTEPQPQAGSYGLVYQMNADGKGAQLIGFKNGIPNSFEIATTYNGVPVTGIADGALTRLGISGTVTFGSYITNIGKNTFTQCPFISEVVLARGVESIEGDAFLGCSGLKKLSYRGTVAEWEKIKKSEGWNYGAAIETVHCLDGIVSVTPHPDTHGGSEGLAYRINQSSSGDFYAVFTGLGTCTDSDIVIASNYFGYPVLELTARALQGKTNIRNVSLPEGITAIPAQFFYECTSLEKITIPKSVTVIDSYAFLGCTSLEKITIPKSVTVIDSYAFLRCTSLEEIKLSEGLESIGQYAFALCTSLAKVNIPDSVTYIGSLSFTDTLIDSIHISKNVTDIDDAYFGANIKSITVDPENKTFVITGNCLIDRERKILLRVFGEPTFPNDGSIRYIEELAFRDIDFEIKKLILPEGLEEILWYDGKGLESVEELHIPSTFVSWGAYTFNQCPNLKKITVAEDNPRYYSVGNCVIERDTGELVLGCSRSVIPNDGSVRSIGRYAFYNRAGLEKIVIPEGVTEIIFRAFANCTSLREVKLPESLRTIDEAAFLGCSALEAIELGKNVNMINMYAFAYCTSLREVTIPEGIYANCLGWDLFRNCTALEKVYVPRGISYIGFNGCSSLREIVYGGTVAEWWEITVYDDDFHGTALERITCTDGVITDIPYETEKPQY